MRIRRLKITNFKAITYIDLAGLKDVVVVAGPNGCGKSCIFDAIRLLKSAYGGYRANEVETWFGEFQIQINQDRKSLLTLFQDPRKELELYAEIELSNDERSWLRENAIDLLVQKQHFDLAPPNLPGLQPSGAFLDPAHRAHRNQIEKGAKAKRPQFLKELRKQYFVAHATVSPTLKDIIVPSTVLSLIFGTYDPKHIGVFDYHGPHRNYAREQVGGIDLNIQATDARVRESALYNYANKYSNLKNEFGAGYVRQLLAREANSSSHDYEDLAKTLRELFTAFFPGKRFLGPQPTPDGKLSFLVETTSGASHDINELSSGEKEVLYGYLRIRNVAPRHSVILIDEPELHLNPRLVCGLPDFYHKHLGRALNNQVWLVTHSDALLRDSVGHDCFSVYHMQQPAPSEPAKSQVTEVVVNKDIDKAVVDLVGDLAAYRPGAKLVIFEGGGDSEFDRRMCSLLFPDFASAVNPISATDKKRVRELHALLEQAREAGTLPFRVYSITDRDSDEIPKHSSAGELRWDVYHIENYLLDSKYILRVLADLNLRSADYCSEQDIDKVLRESASETIPNLIRHELEQASNQLLVKCVRTATDRSKASIAGALVYAINNSAQKFNATVRKDLTLANLQNQEREIKNKLRADLSSGAWRKNFRGRAILKILKDKCGIGGNYDEFRNLIIARMRDDSFKPPGMKAILDKILADPWR